MAAASKLTNEFHSSWFVAAFAVALLSLSSATVKNAQVRTKIRVKGEEMDLKRLLHMGTILQIPQAGLATTDEKLKAKRGEVLEVLKASIEGLEYTQSVRGDNSDIISKWMGLSGAQGLKAYDSVKDTYSSKGYSHRRTEQSLYRYARGHSRCWR